LYVFKEDDVPESGKQEIAVAAANFSHVFPLQVYKYIEAKAGARYALKQVSTFGMADSESERLKKLLDKSRPAGLICISLAPPKEILDWYREAGVPVVIIDEQVEGFTTITTDNMAGGQIAAEYLLKIARKKAAVISGRLNVEGSYNAQQRFAGFKRVFASHGVKFAEEHLCEVINYAYNEGTESFNKLMKEKRDIDAVFCAAGDMCALGVIKAARDHKVPMPEQIALIGYDDIEAAKTSKPALTTIRQPIQQMAEKAYDMILNEKDSLLMHGKKVMFKPELVIRESA
jgi:DNA-binding LacI/PurR family transcriptional regulator